MRIRANGQGEADGSIRAYRAMKSGDGGIAAVARVSRVFSGLRWITVTVGLRWITVTVYLINTELVVADNVRSN